MGGFFLSRSLVESINVASDVDVAHLWQVWVRPKPLRRWNAVEATLHFWHLGATPQDGTFVVTNEGTSVS